MKAHAPPLMRRALWLAASVVAFVMGLVLVAELVSRFVLGLGTPPLYETDAGFEYRLRPNQDVQRFGNHIQVNRWGMRSSDFGNTKTDPQELRVMVFGDSVVNGGSQIDQSELSTAVLQTALHNRLGRPVTVGNISAGSWGPGNWLAYAQRFGFFDADVVVLVLGSGDHADNPVFAPLGTDHPTQAPALASQEAVQRYLPRYLPRFLPQPLLAWVSPAPSTPTAPTTATPTKNSSAGGSAKGLDDLRAFLRMAQAEGRHVVVLHHPDRAETNSSQYLDGHAQIRSLVLAQGLPFVELRAAYRTAGAGVYRDDVHHSPLGQSVMAQALFSAVLQALPMPRPDEAMAGAGERP